jgi:hypothetical protein
MLLDAKVTLYQAVNGRVFHLGATVTVISNDVPEYLAPPSHTFVDLDGQSDVASPIQLLATSDIILASSPGSTISKSWRNQKPSLCWILRNWESDEFWATLSVALSPIEQHN